MIEFTIIQKIAIWTLPVLTAIIIHEVAHGWVASFFGDQTARLSGRLTLNPVKHIDLVGTIIVPLLFLMTSNFIFGWAKPVPVNPRNMRHPQFNMAIVALAGPFSNLIMAVGWAALAKLGMSLDPWIGVPLVYMGEAGIMINIVLGVLNLLPIPPLDGGKVLMSLARGRLAWYLYRLEPFGFFILIFLMITGMLSTILYPMVAFLQNSLVGLFGL